jgi:hypothetical protein
MSYRVSAWVPLLILTAVTATAQTIEEPVAAGSCSVNVRFGQQSAAGTRVELQINKKPLAPVAIAAGSERVSIILPGPLSSGDELRALHIVGGRRNVEPGPAIIVPAGSGSAECAESSGSAASGGDITGDERDSFDTSGYVGMAVDNFAPASVGGYADAEAGGKLTRMVGGVDFEFRALGTKGSRRQLWLFGETMHGVRSADVNCTDADNRPAVCDKLTVGTVGNPGARLQYILDNATSMEAYGGFRYEFLTVGDGTAPAKMYATARLGVMLVNGKVSTGPRTAVSAVQPTDRQTFDANHAYKTHHVGLGLLMPSGSFAGSLLEVGWGVTELFDHPQVKRGWRRLKVDGALSFKMKGPMYGFIQLYSDFDPNGPGADSVQTFYGLSFEVPELFR